MTLYDDKSGTQQTGGNEEKMNALTVSEKDYGTMKTNLLEQSALMRRQKRADTVKSWSKENALEMSREEYEKARQRHLRFGGL